MKMVREELDYMYDIIIALTHFIFLAHETLPPSRLKALHSSPWENKNFMLHVSTV